MMAEPAEVFGSHAASRCRDVGPSRFECISFFSSDLGFWFRLPNSDVEVNAFSLGIREGLGFRA